MQDLANRFIDFVKVRQIPQSVNQSPLADAGGRGQQHTIILPSDKVDDDDDDNSDIDADNGRGDIGNDSTMNSPEVVLVENLILTLDVQKRKNSSSSNINSNSNSNSGHGASAHSLLNLNSTFSHPQRKANAMVHSQHSQKMQRQASQECVISGARGRGLEAKCPLDMHGTLRIVAGT